VSKPFSEEARQEFLAGKHIAVISVATDDGRPPVGVPIWYVYEPGGNILINTGASSRKARLLEKAGAVTVVVQQEELPYQYVIVEGSVVDVAKPSPPEAREKIAVHYLGEEAGKKFASGLGEGSVLFTIRPDRWITADFTGEL
jgi:nitroimidazol reductase NimA-like FMN-containing flavoprotein (pyridoxamine 5'-phosphate oxidase superfamily)